MRDKLPWILLGVALGVVAYSMYSKERREKLTEIARRAVRKGFVI